MKIAFFEIEKWEEAKLRADFPDDELFVSAEKLTPALLSQIKDFEVLSIFVNTQIDSEILQELPHLKLVATRSTGYDHIDLRAAKAQGVAVVSVPGYGDNTVAEFAFGLILNLTRKIYDSIERVKESGSFTFAGLRGMDLKKKTLGVIGTGRIGKESIKMAKGFDMKVVAYDPRPDEQFAKNTGVEYMDLNTLLSASDIITLHCPYIPETHHLINKDNIKHIKPGAYLVNTARGGLVETAALVEALQDGALAGAGLDVLEEEGDVKDELHFLAEGHPKAEEMKILLENHILMKMSNVLITPHNAFNTEEALFRILETTIENIKAFKYGKPVNLVK